MFGHAVLILVPLALGAPGLGAQPAPSTADDHRPSLAVLAVDVDWEKANVVLADDERIGARASDVLRAEVISRGAFDVVDSARLVRALASTNPGGERCRTIRCALEVGRAARADRVLAAKLTKISSPVWILSANVIDVPTGRVVRSEDFELKGAAADMVPKGLAVLARRISAP